MAVSLGEVLAALDARYDPGLAESWDAVGLVCGDPDEPVERVLFAVDPVATVVDELVETGALEDVSGPSDYLDRELGKLDLQSQIDADMSRLRGELGTATPVAELEGGSR